MTPVLRALVLDFDGVVVDSMPPQEQAWRQALEKLPATAAVSEGVLGNLRAGKAGDAMFSGLELTDHERSQLRRSKDELWFPQRGSVPMAPNAAATIRQLSQVVPIGIATTAPADYVHAVLAREHLETAIAAVLTNEDVGHPKPHPEMLHELLDKHLGARPEEAVMVGDTAADAEMSRAAGVPMIVMCLVPASAPALIEGEHDVVGSWAELLCHLRERYGMSPSADGTQ